MELFHSLSKKYAFHTIYDPDSGVIYEMTQIIAYAAFLISWSVKGQIWKNPQHPAGTYESTDRMTSGKYDKDKRRS